MMIKLTLLCCALLGTAVAAAAANEFELFKAISDSVAKKIGTAFYAYTPSAPTAEHIVDPHKPATFSAIDAHKRLVIITHGFGNSHHNEMLESVRTNLLKHTNGEVGTVILVDWKKGAAAPDYVAASTNTQVVVSGFAGKYSQSAYGWKFGRITGLDAAAPFFEGHAGAHLTSTDADFVDAIHTSAGSNILVGEVGFIHAYGHLDFFPNSGHHQPMCHSILHPACSHQSSVLFYDATLSARATCHFNGFTCADWATFLKHTCTKHDVEMGYFADKINVTARGTRYLTTTAKYPYCH
ncbi:hypothetical protein TYRP_017710 [Tyrophagus putrescentiae]|nr:hypothetical protein TYRP_017710 [Tyrophagus putrescentiae]